MEGKKEFCELRGEEGGEIGIVMGCISTSVLGLGAWVKIDCLNRGGKESESAQLLRSGDASII